MINIYNPDITSYKKSSLEAINENWISNHGKLIDLATKKIKEITKSKYAILMANGTCATHCLFLSLKFKYPKINKIYVTNNCYVAAWNTVLMEYDINTLEVLKMNNDTWNITVDEDYFKSLQKNSAVLIVHNLGNIVNVPILKKIRPDLIFVEDNCEGMFGKYEKTYSGMSDSSLCSSCSFYGNKIVTTGEGGAFFTQDEEVYNYIKSVYSQGMSQKKYLHDLHGYNYRMTNIQAGFLYDQLNDINNILKNKYKIFQNYDNLLSELVKLKKVKLIKYEENTKNAPWIYALRIVNNRKSIEETSAFFKSNNIDIRPFFYPINQHKHLKDIKNEDDVSFILNKEIIMIPSSPEITYQEQKIVVDVIYKFVCYTNNESKLNTDIYKNSIIEKDYLFLCCYGRAGYEALNLILLKNLFGYKHIIVFTHPDNNDLLLDFIKNNGIEHFTKSINTYQDILSGKVGFLLSIHYRYIIKSNILNSFDGRAVNVHPSLLPNYKGCFSSVWAIINNEKETGITYHECVPTVDAGNILIQEKIKITETETGYSLFHKLITLAILNLEKLFELIENNYIGIEQKGDGSYYKREVPYNNTVLNEWDSSFKERYIRALHFPPHKPPQHI